MTLDSVKFGEVYYENNGFSLCEVVTTDPNKRLMALVANCLRLKKIIPSIAPTIRDVSLDISSLAKIESSFAEIIDSGVTPDLNPFLIINRPGGVRLSEFVFSTTEDIISVMRQLAICLQLLHNHGLYQRDLDAGWDLFFDGKKVIFAFPAAREMFHKAYIDADDGSTVFDIPRFIVMSGSVLEDVRALLNISLGLVSRTRGSDMAIIQYYLIEHFQELETGGIQASHVIDSFTKLEVNDVLSYEIKHKVKHIAVKSDYFDKAEAQSVRYRDFLFKSIELLEVIPKHLLFLSIIIPVFLLLIYYGRQTSLKSNIVEKSILRQHEELANKNNSAQSKIESVKGGTLDAVESEVLEIESSWVHEREVDSGNSNSLEKDAKEEDEKNEIIDSDSSINSEFMLRVKSSNFEDRISLANELAKTCDNNRDNYKDILLLLLKDPDVLVKAYAVRAYSTCFGKDAELVLQKLYAEEESDLVKGAIKKILNKRR